MSYKNVKAHALGHLRGATTHIAQNIGETFQKYFQSFIANEIFSQHFCQILQNI